MDTKLKKTTLLLGAGAMIPFGGPSTKDITDRLLVHKSCKDIYNIIQEGNSNQCNFESILSAIELLLEWNLSNDRENNMPFHNTCISSIVFQLAQAFRYHATDKVWKIYKDAVNEIIEVIKGYDFYPQHIQHCVGKDVNLLKSFILKCQQACCLKIYTLNYDRLIPNVIRNSLDVYEGIESGRYGYDLKKFVNAPLTYFNLHGSIYLYYDSYTEIKISDVPVELDNAHLIEGGNPNEQKIFLPIIAGYHKSQRMMSKPFNLGFGAFMYDCNSCDKMIIAGYSFGDPHINSVLSVFIRFSIVSVVIVDFSPNYNLSNRYLNTIKRVFNINGLFIPTENGVYDNKEDRITIYLKGFYKYIEEYNYKT